MLKRISIITIILIFVAAMGAVYRSQYHQFNNIETILSQGLDGYLIPHKINYPNKLHNILNDGLRSLELDLLIRSDDDRVFFEIGHDEGETQGITFEDYLRELKNYKIKKIWMDVKNVTEAVIPKVISHLEHLDRKYHIKNIVLFETSLTSNKIAMISEAGFHVTYYLPGEVGALLKRNDPDALARMADKISRQISRQKVSGISFSSSLHPFVKQYLEPKIPETIDFHTWHTIKLRKADALQTLKKLKYFKDKRFKTLIYTYYNVGLNRLYDFSL